MSAETAFEFGARVYGLAVCAADGIRIGVSADGGLLAFASVAGIDLVSENTDVAAFGRFPYCYPVLLP